MATRRALQSAVRRAQSAAGPPDPYKQRAALPGVLHAVAVASGKGGVGKSTTAVNVAAAAASLGLRVGLLDADVYGPSLPLLLGLAPEPPALDGEGKMVPPPAPAARVRAVMSMGLLLRSGAAAAWRGPMVMGAITKMLTGTAWPELDLLLVDMPPGTGDAHISLVQKLPLAGAIIVSTPQEVALADARRGADLFRAVHVPLLGFVQNMAYYEPPGGGERAYLFGRDGVARCAAALGTPLLAEVPLVQAVREASDAGTPLGVDAPGGAGEAYRTIALALARALGLPAGQA
jgi:ATP-binding protein involved in chromosome partitioning